MVGISDMTSLSWLHSWICNVRFGMTYLMLWQTYHLCIVLGVSLVSKESFVSYRLMFCVSFMISNRFDKSEDYNGLGVGIVVSILGI